jgi:hypothetical protein
LLYLLFQRCAATTHFVKKCSVHAQRFVNHVLDLRCSILRAAQRSHLFQFTSLGDSLMGFAVALDAVLRLDAIVRDLANNFVIAACTSIEKTAS